MQNESMPSRRSTSCLIGGGSRGWKTPHVLQEARECAVGVDEQAVVKADGLHDRLVFLDEAAEECLAYLEALLAFGVAALGLRRGSDRPSVSAAVGRRRPGRHRENRHTVEASRQRDRVGAGHADALIENAEVRILEADVVLDAVVADVDRSE